MKCLSNGDFTVLSIWAAAALKETRVIDWSAQRKAGQIASWVDNSFPWRLAVIQHGKTEQAGIKPGPQPPQLNTSNALKVFSS